MVKKKITYLLVTMDDISRMDVLCGFEQLVHDETFVDVLQNGTTSDHIM
jgi:hypothetical protein